MPTDHAGTYAANAAWRGQDERRRRSPEAGYGITWSDGHTPQAYRVGHLTDTGGVSAVGLMPPVAPVEVLGVVVEPERHVTFDFGLPGLEQSRTLDSALEGWSEPCGPRVNGLQCVWERISREPWCLAK